MTAVRKSLTQPQDSHNSACTTASAIFTDTTTSIFTAAHTLSTLSCSENVGIFGPDSISISGLSVRESTATGGDQCIFRIVCLCNLSKICAANTEYSMC